MLSPVGKGNSFARVLPRPSLQSRRLAPDGVARRTLTVFQHNPTLTHTVRNTLRQNSLGGHPACRPTNGPQAKMAPLGALGKTRVP